MQPHELEIDIGKDGKVRVKTVGVKGRSCLEYLRLVERIVGRPESRELTPEFYEPESTVRIDGSQQQHERRG